MVVVNDDVAVENSTYTQGRRGIAGTVLVHKFAGKAASLKMDLDQVTEIAQEVIDNVRTMGISLGSVTVPAVGKASFKIDEDEMEIGLGIHGEPGIKKSKMLSSKEIVKLILDRILADLDYKNSEVLVLINNLGATTDMELSIVAKDTFEYLESKNIKIVRAKKGTFMTSLDMPGISISVLKITKKLKPILEKFDRD